MLDFLKIFNLMLRPRKTKGAVEQTGEDKGLQLKLGISPASSMSYWCDAEPGMETHQLHFFFPVPKSQKEQRYMQPRLCANISWIVFPF